MADLREEPADSGSAPPAAEGEDVRGDESELVKSTYLLLKAYAKSYKKIRFDFASLVKFTSAYVEQYGGRYRELRIFATNPRALLFKNLEELEKRNRVRLAYKGAAIESVYFPLYAVLMVQKAYEEIARNPEIPFPSDDNIDLELPPDLMDSLDVQNGLLELLRSKPKDERQIFRLTFPEHVASMLIIPEILPRRILDLAISKIRVYLNRSSNASYIQSRLRPAFRDHQVSMQNTLNHIVIKPGAAAAEVEEAGDFTFRFWAHFSNMLAREQNEKRDLLASERSLAQAAYIMGTLNVYYREQVRNKENEKAEALKALDKELKRPPYAYTLKDLLGLKDKKGGPLIKQEAMERVTQFLNEKIRPANNRILPELLMMRAGAGRETYIYKNLAPLVFVQELRRAASAMRDFYLQSWPESIRRDEKPPAMEDDNQFLRDVQARINTHHPLFAAFLDYGLLTGLERETTIRSELLPEYAACFNRRLGKLKPLNEILKLDRKDLARITIRNLRFWERYRLLRKLVRFLAGIFRSFTGQAGAGAHPVQAANLKKGFVKIDTERESIGMGAGSNAEHTEGPAARRGSAAAATGPGRPSGAKTYAEKKAAYQKAVVALKEQFVGRGGSIPRTLSELAEQWNPLYDPKARSNLVEDVNSMIRDYIRGLRKGFRIKPPDAARIRELARKLSRHSTFERIKKKDLFQRYIEIYMISLLGDLVTVSRK